MAKDILLAEKLQELISKEQEKTYPTIIYTSKHKYHANGSGLEAELCDLYNGQETGSGAKVEVFWLDENDQWVSLGRSDSPGTLSSTKQCCIYAVKFPYNPTAAQVFGNYAAYDEFIRTQHERVLCDSVFPKLSTLQNIAYSVLIEAKNCAVTENNNATGIHTNAATLKKLTGKLAKLLETHVNPALLTAKAYEDLNGSASNFVFSLQKALQESKALSVKEQKRKGTSAAYVTLEEKPTLRALEEAVCIWVADNTPPLVALAQSVFESAINPKGLPLHPIKDQDNNLIGYKIGKAKFGKGRVFFDLKDYQAIIQKITSELDGFYKNAEDMQQGNLRRGRGEGFLHHALVEGLKNKITAFVTEKGNFPKKHKEHTLTINVDDFNPGSNALVWANGKNQHETNQHQHYKTTELAQVITKTRQDRILKVQQQQLPKPPLQQLLNRPKPNMLNFLSHYLGISVALFSGKNHTILQERDALARAIIQVLPEDKKKALKVSVSAHLTGKEIGEGENQISPKEILKGIYCYELGKPENYPELDSLEKGTSARTEKLKEIRDNDILPKVNASLEAVGIGQITYKERQPLLPPSPEELPPGIPQEPSINVNRFIHFYLKLLHEEDNTPISEVEKNDLARAIIDGLKEERLGVLGIAEDSTHTLRLKTVGEGPNQINPYELLLGMLNYYRDQHPVLETYAKEQRLDWLRKMRDEYIAPNVREALENAMKQQPQVNLVY